MIRGAGGGSLLTLVIPHVITFNQVMSAPNPTLLYHSSLLKFKAWKIQRFIVTTTKTKTHRINLFCFRVNKKTMRTHEMEQTWIGKASISALRATNGGDPVPMAATTPVLATGHRYPTPSSSSSRLMTALVANSSNASSGFSWISLLIIFIQSTATGSLASPVMISFSEEFRLVTSTEFREDCKFKQEKEETVVIDIRKKMKSRFRNPMAEIYESDNYKNQEFMYVFIQNHSVVISIKYLVTIK